jgi:hypothetical protein
LRAVCAGGAAVLAGLRGQLLVVGGGGGRPTAQPPPPRRPLRLLAWIARKACEIHVVLNMLALTALGQLLAGDRQLLIGRIYLAVMAPTAAAVAGWTLLRSQKNEAAEREFAAWFRVPEGHELTFADGWWIVQRAEDGKPGNDA